MEREFTKIEPVPEEKRVRYSIEVFDKNGFLYASFLSRDFILNDIDVSRYVELGYTVKTSKL